jgi:hypothetical protein
MSRNGANRDGQDERNAEGRMMNDELKNRGL